MAYTVQVVTSLSAAQARAARSAIAAWYDDTVRCSPSVQLLQADEIRDYIADPNVVVAVVRDDTNAIVGAAIGQKSNARVLWLMAKPGEFAAVTHTVCSAIKAAGLDPWGVVENPNVHQRFVDSGYFEDISGTHGPNALRYIGD